MAAGLVVCVKDTTPREAEAPPRPYRDAALEAASWLRSVAVEFDTGLSWPMDPDQEATPSTMLYSGSAGVVLFFLELARVTGEETWLDDARRGADHLVAGLPEVLPPFQSGLYTGAAGIGYVLARVAEATGEDTYAEAARRVVRLLADSAVTKNAGVDWNGVTDIVSGASGTGLFLLYAGRVLDDPDATELAVEAGRYLLEISEPAEGGRRWQMGAGIERVMPNFSHGTAGIAYFLAALYLETGDEAFLDAALEGAHHLLTIAEVTETACLIHHHSGDGEDLFYLSWCHGPAGTGRLFYRLYEATGDEVWLDWLRKQAAALVESGIPEERTPGFWNNVGQCCGSAGVGEFLLAIDRTLDGEHYRDLVTRLADDVLDRATRTDDGLKWIQAEHRIEPELLIAQTGFMQGAAGIGIFLLDVDAAIHGLEPGAVLPDSPFG